MPHKFKDLMKIIRLFFALFVDFIFIQIIVHSYAHAHFKFHCIHLTKTEHGFLNMMNPQSSEICLIPLYAEDSYAPPFQTFTSRKVHATYTELNHLHFPRIQNLIRKFHTDNFYEELLICATVSHVDSSLDTTLLTTSKRRSVAIDIPSPQNLHFLTPPFHSYHTSF